MMSAFEILTLTQEQKVKGVWLSGIKGEGEYKCWWSNGNLFTHSFWENGQRKEGAKWYNDDGSPINTLLKSL